MLSFSQQESHWVSGRESPAGASLLRMEGKAGRREIVGAQKSGREFSSRPRLGEREIKSAQNPSFPNVGPGLECSSPAFAEYSLAEHAHAPADK
jgi:hypothetical protein